MASHNVPRHRGDRSAACVCSEKLALPQMARSRAPAFQSSNDTFPSEMQDFMAGDTITITITANEKAGHVRAKGTFVGRTLSGCRPPDRLIANGQALSQSFWFYEGLRGSVAKFS